MTALQAKAFVAQEPTDPSELVPELTRLSLGVGVQGGVPWTGAGAAVRGRCIPIARCGRRSRRSVTSVSSIRE